MPPWPKERVNKALPFDFSGLDYFRLLYMCKGAFSLAGNSTSNNEDLGLSIHLSKGQNSVSGDSELSCREVS